MNLMIDYDVIDAICDTKDGFTPGKIIRNNKSRWAKYYLPAMFLMSYILVKDEEFKYFPQQVLTFLILTFSMELVAHKFLGDVYKEKSILKLQLLVVLLKDLEIHTSYDLLTESYCYHKIHNLKLNDKKIPQIIESKYILIPSYDYKGDIVDTSVLQEHVLGSNTYTLSLGSFKKVLKPVTIKT